MRHVIGILLVLVPSLLAGEEVRCPATVSVRQSLENPPAGWSVSYDTLGHPLATITFYDGRPVEKASLVNDAGSKTKTQSIAVWHFLPNAERQVWLACQYAGTTVVLAKTLPHHTKECSVTYSLRETIGGFPVVKKIDCK